MAVMKLTKQNFTKEAREAAEIVLIDFWAAWCGPCRMLSPIVDEIAEENHAGLKVCKVNIDEEPELAQEFNVMSIPTLVVMKQGRIAATSVGVKPKSAIMDMIAGT